MISTRLENNCIESVIFFIFYKKKPTRKKRWGGNNKSNLRNAPYYLKDGDTIGVKVKIVGFSLIFKF